MTPVAAKTGMLLSKRLFGTGTEKMDFINVPTTVFTPIEYGCIGYTEADAKKKFGDDNVSTFHTQFQPLEWQYTEKRDKDYNCYVKVLVNHADNDRVVGFHMLSPHAGEITQGVGIGFKMGMTKQHLDSVIGIHPTIAEEFTMLTKTKEANPDAQKSGC